VIDRVLALTSSARIVLLTQPAPRVTSISAGLLGRGYSPLVLPFSAVETAPFLNAVALARSRIFGSPESIALEDRAWDLVVFVSPSAVLAFLGDGQSCDLREWPAALAVATVGPGTLDALATGGLPLSVRRLAPKQAPWDASSLLASIREEGVRLRRVLVVGGSTSGTDWATEFQSMGVQCEWLTAYRIQLCEPDTAVVDRLRALCSRQIAWVSVVTQAPTAEALNRIAADWPLLEQRWLRAQLVLTIHPRIEQSLINGGFQSIQRIPPGASALEAALSSVLWSNPR
jgi:uroporphyrinogen-III synthase